jgi:hypothetical protein
MRLDQIGEPLQLAAVALAEHIGGIGNLGRELDCGHSFPSASGAVGFKSIPACD